MLALPLLGACATSGVREARTSRALEPVRRVSAPAKSLRSFFTLDALLGAPDHAKAGPLGRDETVGLSGFIGETVNQVVPIPGTDMIRVGAIQEGTFFQSSVRTVGGTSTGAVIIFRIRRP